MADKIPSGCIALVNLEKKRPKQAGAVTLRLVKIQITPAVSESGKVNDNNPVATGSQGINILTPAKCRPAEAMNKQDFPFRISQVIIPGAVMYKDRIDGYKMTVRVRI
jgi:hypothetical protein